MGPSVIPSRVVERTRLSLAVGAVLFLASCSAHDPAAAENAARRIESQLRQDLFTAARDAARKNAAAWRDRPASDAYSRFRILEAEALLAMGDAPGARQILVALAPVETPLRVRREIDLGNAMLKLERYQESKSMLDSGTRLAAANSLNRLMVEGFILKASLLSRTGESEAGERLLRDALGMATSDQRAMILNNLGNSRSRQSHYDEAVPYFEKALAALGEQGSLRLRSMFLSNLASCRYQLGDFDAAFRMQGEAIAIQEKIGANLALAYSYGETGRLYHGQNELQKAISYYKRAFELAHRLNARSLAATWAVNLSRAYLQSQDWTNAEFYNRQSRTLGESANDDLAMYIKLNSAGIAAGRGNRAQATRDYRELAATTGLDAGLRWTAYDELAKLRAAAGEVQQSNRDFASAIGLITDVRAGLSRTDEKITFLSQPIQVYQDYVDALIDRGETDQALAVTDSSRAQVLLGQPENSGAADRYRQAARASNSVLLAYWITPRRSFAWVVTANSTHFAPLSASGPVLRELVTTYREEIEHGIRDPLTNPASSGWKLYEAVLKPVQPWIPSGANVIVAPDGPLHDINLETIPAPGERPHYWIEQAVVSVAPSLGILTRRYTTPQTRRRGILLIGDPEPFAQYGKLVYATQEIDSIGRRFPAHETKRLTAAAATVNAYRDSHPEKFGWIHFTAHAEANRETPLDSAVILSPVGDRYKLYARDIRGPLNAELVTVSACTSAGAKAYSGEGLIGFAWAFLHAGAHNVIAGLWDVDDESTAQLMDRLYGGIEARHSPREALREAKLILLHSTGNRRKPFFWGPFQLYGARAGVAKAASGVR